MTRPRKENAEMHNQLQQKSQGTLECLPVPGHAACFHDVVSGDTAKEAGTTSSFVMGQANLTASPQGEDRSGVSRNEKTTQPAAKRAEKWPRVFVVSATREPLMPCTPARARILMAKGKAAVLRLRPFTIILTERETGDTQPIAVKADPGSKATGMAVVANFPSGKKVVLFAAEVKHRGAAIKESMEARRAQRSSRRNRKCRNRPSRFDNRTRKEGWLPPSLDHRLKTTMTWVRKLMRFCPVTELVMEHVKFDMQKMQNKDIAKLEYQQGELQGYELKEYLLETRGRHCAYCGGKDRPLEVEHIVAKSNGGSNRVSNLTLACTPCNQAKGSQPVEVFLAGKPDVLKRVIASVKTSLKDAAAVNTTRNAIKAEMEKTGLPVETGSGGMTKFNRKKQSYPKAHWIDAACAGASGLDVLLDPAMQVLEITSKGHGNRQMCRTNKYGIPIAHRTHVKVHFGFQTGDIVRATIPKGKYAGTHVGRVLCRATGNFDIQTKTQRFSVSYKHLKTIHKMDGYSYDLS